MFPGTQEQIQSKFTYSFEEELVWILDYYLMLPGIQEQIQSKLKEQHSCGTQPDLDRIMLLTL